MPLPFFLLLLVQVLALSCWIFKGPSTKLWISSQRKLPNPTKPSIWGCRHVHVVFHKKESLGLMKECARREGGGLAVIGLLLLVESLTRVLAFLPIRKSLDRLDVWHHESQVRLLVFDDQLSVSCWCA